MMIHAKVRTIIDVQNGSSTTSSMMACTRGPAVAMA
jgi:hypothetical protein